MQSIAVNYGHRCSVVPFEGRYMGVWKLFRVGITPALIKTFLSKNRVHLGYIAASRRPPTRSVNMDRLHDLDRSGLPERSVRFLDELQVWVDGLPPGALQSGTVVIDSAGAQTHRAHHDHACSVYLLKAGPDFKIGIAKNVAHRVKTLQTGNANVVRTVFTRRYDERREAMGIEKSLHDEFRMFRSTGEWFRPPNVSTFPASVLFALAKYDLQIIPTATAPTAASASTVAYHQNRLPEDT